MSWQGHISTMIRHLVNDLDETSYKYSDKRLEKTILVAAQMLLTNVNLVQPYNVNIEGCSLSPDPTDADTKDDDFIVMVALKSACIILGSEVRSESGNAISIKDGPSAIDLRGVSSTLMALYKDLCEKYEQAVIDYSAGNSIAGHAILGPYAPGSDFVRRTYSDYELRGGYFNY